MQQGQALESFGGSGVAQRAERESIWSIRKDDLMWYSYLFPIFWVLGMIYYGKTGLYAWDGWWQVVRSLSTLMVETSGLTGLSAAIMSLMALAVKGVVGKMPLFDFGRSDREEKIRREALKEGARRLERARDAWDEKKANGGTDAPRPTADSIDNR